MPRRSLFTDTQLETLFVFPESAVEIARYYTFDERIYLLFANGAAHTTGLVSPFNCAICVTPDMRCHQMRHRQIHFCHKYRSSHALSQKHGVSTANAMKHNVSMPLSCKRHWVIDLSQRQSTDNNVAR